MVGHRFLTFLVVSEREFFFDFIYLFFSEFLCCVILDWTTIIFLCCYLNIKNLYCFMSLWGQYY